ncbi:MAG: DUF1573 domain-containing protein [Planctomycetes bacterium]|nr:DUF1573 domain-containing protein [Planctomycetota bacterium]
MENDPSEAFAERVASLRRALLVLGLGLHAAGFGLTSASALASVVQTPSGAQEKAKGNLVFSVRDHSFGSLLEGDEATFDFGFEVTGDRPVTITRVQSTCGCTVPILEVGGQPYGFGTALPPGSKGFVRARVKTYDFVGAKSSQITVLSDGGESSIVLSISSFVRRFFLTEPEFLNLGEVLEGEKRKATVKVRTAEVPEFAIEGWGGARTRREVPLEANGRPKIGEKEIRERELEDALTLQPQPSGVAVKYERSAPNEWTLEVEVDATAIPVGSFLHTLRFRTGAQRAFDVRVQGVVLPLVGTQPSPRLAFGLLRRGQAKEISIALVDYDPGVEVKLLSAALVTAELAGHLEIGSAPTAAKNDDAGRPTWPIAVTAKSSLPAGPFKGLLELRTDHPKYPVIQIEVTGFVR